MRNIKKSIKVSSTFSIIKSLFFPLYICSCSYVDKSKKMQGEYSKTSIREQIRNSYGRGPFELAERKFQNYVLKMYPLQEAAILNDLSSIKLLLKYPVGIDQSTLEYRGCSYPPLYLALKNENYEIAKYLIQEGANTNYKNQIYGTPLHLAAKITNKKIGLTLADLLIKKGADINSVIEDKFHKETPLSNCVYYSHNELLLIALLNNGVDTKIKYKDGKTIYDIARSCPCSDILSKYKDYEDLIKWDYKDLSIIENTSTLALISAVRRNEHALCVKAINNNANIHVLDMNKNSLLHIARSISVIKLLIDNGLNINIKNNKGRTPLHTYVSAKKLELIIFCLANGIKINEKDNEGKTALYESVNVGNYDITKCLLLGRANKYLKTNNNKSSFDIAEPGTKCYDLVRLNSNLIEKIKDAASKGNLKTINEIIEEKLVDKTYLLYLSCKNGYNKLLFFLINDLNVDINKKVFYIENEFMLYPLHVAVKNNNIEVIDILLKHSSKEIIEISLEAAIMNDNSIILDKLLKTGISIDNKDNNGHNIFFKACSWGKIKSVKILLEHKVLINDLDRFGDTPLIKACQKGHDEVIEVLLENNADRSIENVKKKKAIDYIDRQSSIYEILNQDNNCKCIIL